LELKTALLVPRPALPVAASLSGGGVQLVEAEPVVVEEEHGDHHSRMEAIEKRFDLLERDLAPVLQAHYAANL
jgi:hypothetical protein